MLHHAAGDPSDTLDVEIYQPWLEPASQQQLEQQREAARTVREQYLQQGDHKSCHDHHHDHHQHHDHSHHHGSGVIDHGDHVHEERSKVGDAKICAVTLCIRYAYCQATMQSCCAQSSADMLSVSDVSN